MDSSQRALQMNEKFFSNFKLVTLAEILAKKTNFLSENIIFFFFKIIVGREY